MKEKIHFALCTRHLHWPRQGVGAAPAADSLKEGRRQAADSSFSLAHRTIFQASFPDMEPNAALKEPRFHQQWAPDELKIEKAFGDETMAELEKLGHNLDKVTTFGACQAILWDADRKLLVPAHDPHVPGKADGQ